MIKVRQKKKKKQKSKRVENKAVTENSRPVSLSLCIPEIHLCGRILQHGNTSVAVFFLSKLLKEQAHFDLQYVYLLKGDSIHISLPA